MTPASPTTFREAVSAVGQWLRTNTQQVVFYAILGAIGGYVFNVLLLMFAYDGFRVPEGRVGVGEGNVLLGSLGIAIATTIGFSLFGYARSVGLKRFASELAALPRQLGVLFQRDGSGARVHLLWGAAVALLARQVIGPGFGALLAIGLLVYLPSILGQVLIRLGMRAVYAISRLFRPSGASGPSSLAMAVGVLGTIFALAIGTFIENSTVLLVAAVACGAGAVVLSKGGTPAQAATLIVGLVLPALLLADVPLAWADDGGMWEHRDKGGTLANWIRSAGATTVLIWGGGAVPSAVAGGVVGGAAGGVMSGGGWDFSGLTGDPPVAQEGVTDGVDEDMQDHRETTPVDGLDESVTTFHPELVNPDTGEPLTVHDGTYEGGEPGMVWDDYDGWVSPAEAARNIAERRQQIAAREREIEQWERDTQEAFDRNRVQREERYAAEREAEAAARQETEARRAREQRIDQGLDRLMDDRLHDPAWMERWERAQDQAMEGNPNELAELYRDSLREDVQASAAEAKAEERYEQALAVGEWTARGVEMGARGAMMTVGGHVVAAHGVLVGIGAAATGMGSIQGASEGAEAQAQGKDASTVIQRTAGGFLSGAKDGAVGTITGLPGTSGAVRVLLPAATDAAETYIRTGNAGQALASGVIGAIGGAAGEGVDAMLPPGAAQTATGMVVNATAAGATAASQGGSFQEGFVQGLASDVATRAGGHVASGRVGLSEQRARDALAEGHAQRTAPTTIEQQSAAIQGLAQTQHDRVQLDAQGRVVTRPDGSPATESYVNARDALDQLRDTSGSRTGKTLNDPDHPGLRDAIVRTRMDDLYAPADQNTIAAVGPRLHEAGMMRPGDRLVMDPFSTPGKAPSLGADRDARLVIERPRVDGQGRPVLDSSGRPEMQRIEVPRTHWENQALADFYQHTQAIATEGGRAITPETNPDYFDRLHDVLLREGHSSKTVAQMTPQQMLDAAGDRGRHHAWAEAHNQLFTDRFHMEASRGNTDQGVQRVVGSDGTPRAEAAQGHANVLDVKDGTARLADPEGYARMWQEKSDFYRNNPPEALAQSQKGIAEYMGLRDGYRRQGLEPPPINPNVARAMEVVGRAPVGTDATPAALARVEADLQALGYRSTSEAMTAIAWQNEGLKWSRTMAVPGASGGLRTAQVGALTRPGVEDETAGF